MKKLIALVLALALVLASCAIAFADDQPTKYRISVDSSDHHTYRVYQVLTGTLANGNSKNLGNPAWGADAADTNADVNAFITSITGKTEKQISTLVAAAANTTTAGRGTVDKDHSMEVVPGYYVLVDITDADDLAAGESLSLNIVEVVRNVTVTAKVGTTTSDKTTGDVNDSTGTSTDIDQKSADYDIGDHIPYTLTATLPQNYASYVKYYLQFQDDMSAGLTLDTNSVKIYYGDSDTTGTSISFTAAAGTSYTNGHLYTYTIADVKTAAPDLVAGNKIYIKYTATLNSNAAINGTGNPNKSKVVFSKNPNWDGTGTPDTGETPEKIVVVFTYKTVFNKVDGTGKPLTGADFRLEKFIKNASGDVEYKGLTGTWTNVIELGDTVHPTKTVSSNTVGEDTAQNAKFTFAGLDDGYYRLIESVTPSGYNTLADTYFEITATHTVSGLTALAGTDGHEFNLTASLSDASLTGNIVNNQGTELPSTGGIGTTIFYIVGGLLLVGAAVILVARRKAHE